MQEEKFSPEELHYINKDIFSKAQNIYASTGRKSLIPSKYHIYCKDLPIGKYFLKGRFVKLGYPAIWKIAYGSEKNLTDSYEHNPKEGCEFKILGETDFYIEVFTRDVTKYVKSLREQAALNKRKVKEKQRTIYY